MSAIMRIIIRLNASINSITWVKLKSTQVNIVLTCYILSKL